ncbi:GNAT family N-acetyltransferase [Nonomuraea sp. NPDC050663]|uniref:GNAT family N-acetyltransferase n=1 Tax=Nonomuraea sp. NPDC050663 TaxID=3364370 RepID=UPI0037BB2FC6
MTADFIRFVPDDADDLVAFLTGEEWPFHTGVPQEAAVRSRIVAGHYDDDDERTFWIVAGGERAGLVRLQDFSDDTPLFDLRIRAAHRGKGLGSQAVRWLVRHLFESRPEIRRIEGTTRHDNLAMRAVFLRAGFAKEAHYREGWPGLDGKVYDSVGYGILRSDWERGVVTPPDWNS